MNVEDFGNTLIEGDLKRLKKLKSLKKDLQVYFAAHANQLKSFGRLSCEIASGKDYIVCKERITVTNPRLPPAKGCRLWFVVTRSGYYIRCLIYRANEENKFKKSICFKVVRKRLEAILQDPSFSL